VSGEGKGTAGNRTRAVQPLVRPYIPNTRSSIKYTTKCLKSRHRRQNRILLQKYIHRMKHAFRILILGSASCCACITEVQVPPYATPVFVLLFIAPFTLHVSALLIGHLQV
jgi:hypothetical protein